MSDKKSDPPKKANPPDAKDQKADPKNPQAPAAKTPAASAAPEVPSALDQLKAPSEKEALVQELTKLERENKSLKGQLESSSPELIAELRNQNKDLKKALLDLETSLFQIALERKQALEVGTITDHISTTKLFLLEYLKLINAEPALCKKIESL